MAPDWNIVNGELCQGGKISIDDRGYTLGDGLFETVPLYDKTPYLLDAHFIRLEKTAKVIGISLPMNLVDLENGIKQLADKNSVTRGVARLTVTRGGGVRGYAPPGNPSPTWTLTVRAFEPVSGERWETGYKLAPVAMTKKRGSVVHTIKTTSAIEKILMIAEAHKNGADEVLALTDNHKISSGAACNLFWIKDSGLYTPSIECAILEGTARGVVIDIAKEIDMEVNQGEYQTKALAKADEVFVTNALIEVMPVTAIIGIFEAFGSGPVTRQIAEKYFRRIGKR